MHNNLGRGQREGSQGPPALATGRRAHATVTFKTNVHFSEAALHDLAACFHLYSADNVIDWMIFSLGTDVTRERWVAHFDNTNAASTVATLLNKRAGDVILSRAVATPPLALPPTFKEALIQTPAGGFNPMQNC